MKNKTKYIPELICELQPIEGKQKGLYVVRIPKEFLPEMPYTASIYEYRFIGIKMDIK